MKVFISHAVTDAKLAERVAHVLREAGFQVWDETQILPGDNWGMQLAEALQESEAMVVLLTPNSLHAPNLSHEVGYALGNAGYKGRVIPVLTNQAAKAVLLRCIRLQSSWQQGPTRLRVTRNTVASRALLPQADAAQGGVA